MIKKLFALLICAVVLSSCAISDLPPENASTNKQAGDLTSAKSSSKAIYQKISANEARKIMESGKSFSLLDVRTVEEYKQKRIDGSILIPDFEITNRAELELPDKKQAILIYCRSGRRSANAAKELVDMGYTNVYDFGGILDWPYETIKG